MSAQHELHRALGERMTEYKQALVEAALSHPVIVDFTLQLQELLRQIERNDVEIYTSARVTGAGVKIYITINFDSLYPGQMAEDPARCKRMYEAEANLDKTLRGNGIKIRGGVTVGQRTIMRTKLIVLEGIVNYHDGSFVETIEKNEKIRR